MQGRSLALLLTLAVGCAALAMGLRQSFGLYLAPMTTALGWSTSGFALAIALQVLVNGFSQPVVGQLADRFGGRVVVIGGALLYAAGIAGMALSPGLGGFTFFAGIVMGVAVSAAGMPVIVASLTRQLPDSMRGRAAALGTAGSSLGQFLVVPLSGAALSGFGWQAALLGMAGIALLMIPLAIPLAGRPAQVTRTAGDDEPAGAALARAFRSRMFWCLFFGFFVCGLHVSFLAVHLPGFVALCHLPTSVGAWAISLIGLFNVVGSLGAGELTQRWRRRELLVGIYGLRALVMAVFFFAAEKTTGSILVFSALMGILWLSTVPPTVALCARLFGTRWLATIFGLVFLGHQVGGFLGAWLPGLIYDRTGSYDAMWIISIAGGIFAALIHLPLREPAPAIRPAAA
ncbi:MFS transporter [Pararoseomonas indoligenes]|uniref:MFS transporter n=1 Tax=Roseomonas indoligenes TaxID=2820811 RepID=A0A940MY88_9PROT|nr:MFS transporter [Pararoseomonas indoligenes]MBP0493230.1 MFS transporter [Pararoseomonas indoligenes]